ncbi:hypothetical protein AB0280_15570 [Pseudarthrobacter sp902506025]|uniref:hypothetical protein n=1 Tax=Pseudarthrobacter sp. 902506025 TaxID=3155291 RepID=UPI00344C5601
MTQTTKTSFWNTNVGKTFKAALYLAASAGLSYLITASANDQALFGPVTAIINVALVFVKQTWFTSTTPNLGSN